jgi:Cu-processing system permease protein
MRTRALVLVAARELREALRSHWFVLAAGCFLVLSLGLALLGLAGAQRSGLAGFDRTTASLLNLALLFVPLVTLSLGGLGIAGELEDASLGMLLAQPLTRLEVYAGKYVGLLTAVGAAICTGFGTTGVVVGVYAGGANVRAFLGLVALVLLLGAATLGVGTLLSVALRSRARVIGAAFSAWLVLVYVSDLGVIGLTIARSLRPAQVFVLALLNPVEQGARARRAAPLRPPRRARPGRRLRHRHARYARSGGAARGGARFDGARHARRRIRALPEGARHVSAFARTVAGGAVALGVLVAAVVLWPGDAATGPEPIAWGRDTCARCRMHLSQPGYAGEMRDRQGTLHKFDDIGCAVGTIVATHAEVPEAGVEDHDGGGFVPLLAARLVRTEGVQTPMGHGVVAFKDEAAARAFASSHAGGLIAFEQLLGDRTWLARATGRPLHEHGSSE